MNEKDETQNPGLNNERAGDQNRDQIGRADQDPAVPPLAQPQGRVSEPEGGLRADAGAAAAEAEVEDLPNLFDPVDCATLDLEEPARHLWTIIFHLQSQMERTDWIDDLSKDKLNGVLHGLAKQVLFHSLQKGRVLTEVQGLRDRNKTLELLLQGADSTCARIADLVDAKPSHRDLVEAVQIYVESHSRGANAEVLLRALHHKEKEITSLQEAISRALKITQEMRSGKVTVTPAKAATQIYAGMISDALKLKEEK